MNCMYDVSDQPPLKKEDLIHNVKYIQIITKNRLHCKRKLMSISQSEKCPYAWINMNASYIVLRIL